VLAELHAVVVRPWTAPGAGGGSTQAKQTAARRVADRIRALRIMKFLPSKKVFWAWEPRL
jgi:hypothetical protein